jgi:hypothetical protein
MEIEKYFARPRRGRLVPCRVRNIRSAINKLMHRVTRVTLTISARYPCPRRRRLHPAPRTRAVARQKPDPGTSPIAVFGAHRQNPERPPDHGPALQRCRYRPQAPPNPQSHSDEGQSDEKHGHVHPPHHHARPAPGLPTTPGPHPPPRPSSPPPPASPPPAAHQT